MAVVWSSPHTAGHKKCRSTRFSSLTSWSTHRRGTAAQGGWAGASRPAAAHSGAKRRTAKYEVAGFRGGLGPAQPPPRCRRPLRRRHHRHRRRQHRRSIAAARYCHARAVSRLATVVAAVAVVTAVVARVVAARRRRPAVSRLAARRPHAAAARRQTDHPHVTPAIAVSRPPPGGASAPCSPRCRARSCSPWNISHYEMASLIDHTQLGLKRGS